MSGPVLRVENLTYRRGGAGFRFSMPVLRVGPGEAIALCGPSGSGKSTLIDILALLRAPSTVGAFEIDGVDVAGLWRARRSRACARLRSERIGCVLQTGGLLPFLSVYENVMLGQRLLGRTDPARALMLMRRLGIDGLAGRRPEALSIGERQRVAVARALAHGPRLVLADEPTASLDAGNAKAVLQLLLELIRESGAALLVASHDRPAMRQFGIPIAAMQVDGCGTRVEHSLRDERTRASR